MNGEPIKKYVITDKAGHVAHEIYAEWFEIIGDHVVFFSNYDIRKTEMVLKFAPGWSMVRVEEETNGS